MRMVLLENMKADGDGVLAAPTSPPIPPILSRTFRGEDKENNRVPRFHKLEFPVFDRKEDLLPWLKRCAANNFFVGNEP